jgi:hypothetical protein
MGDVRTLELESGDERVGLTLDELAIGENMAV